MQPDRGLELQDARPKELTVRALVLGVLLSAVMAAANAYLGLFAGMTVSASIPAAVVSMLLLRAVRGSILENNLVQTAASAGESVAAGAIFTLPALLMTWVWGGFGYIETLTLLAAGGIVGTVFTIPLRRILVDEGELPFPEGTATARVLQVGHQGGSAFHLIGASGLAFAIKVFEGGLGLLKSQTALVLTGFGRSWVLGTALSPALFGVGAILGLRSALFLALGGIFNWVFVIPFVATPGATPGEAAWQAWSHETRFLGVGAMAAGGIITLLELSKPIRRAFFLLIERSRATASLDLGPRTILGLMILSCSLIFLGAFFSLGEVPLSAIVVVFALFFAFLFCAVAAYMAGLIGSSNNPVSGVTLATLLLVSGLFALGRGSQADRSPLLEGAALFVGAVVCTALAIAGDTIQDLKAGSLLGARPRSQQIAQLLGVLAAALVLGPVLELLEAAYGFGSPTPSHPNPLRAPQATLMAAVVHGVFGGSLPWNFVLPGALIAVALSLLNVSRRRGGRAPVPMLAVAVGLYLPLELEIAMVLGAIAARVSGIAPSSATVLLGAGLITGEALAGLVVAIAVVLGATLPHAGTGYGVEVISLLVSLAVLALIAKSARIGSAGEEEN